MTASKSASATSADRAWVALRIVDVLRSNGINAFYDKGRVSTGSETIDVGSLLPHLANVDRAAWAVSVDDYAVGVVNRIVNGSHAPSSPLGRLVVRNARAPRVASPRLGARSLAEITGLTPRNPTVVDNGPQPPVQLFAQPRQAPMIEPEPQALDDSLSPGPVEANSPAPVSEIEVQREAQSSSSAIDLSDAIARLTVRIISDEMTASIPEVALGPSTIAGTRTALCLGADRWVTDGDLSHWQIDAEMARSMAESRVESAVRPDIDVVLIDSTSRVFVLESDEPEVAAALAFLELHVPIRPDESAIVATGGEHVAVVSLGDHPTAAALNALVDAAVREHAQRPGRLHPGLYRWNPGGNLTVIADDLHTAAGRLAARALVTSREDVVA